MSERLVNAGVDVSKAILEAYLAGRRAEFANTKAGINRLAKWLLESASLEDLRIVCEATGGYESALLVQLTALGFWVSRVTPSRVRSHAKGQGILAKTDKIDAELIADFASKSVLRRFVISNEDVVKIRALFQAAEVLEETCRNLNNQLEHATEGQATKAIKKVIVALTTQVRNLNKQIDITINNSEELKLKYSRINEIQGIGRKTTIAFIALMPELGSISDEQASAMVGVAPFNDDSGPRKGKRRITGGRPELRRLLYMASVTASRINPVLKVVYENLRKRGKMAKVALVALMRKLVILANRMVKNPAMTIVSK